MKTAFYVQPLAMRVMSTATKTFYMQWL